MALPFHKSKECVSSQKPMKKSSMEEYPNNTTKDDETSVIWK